MLLMDEFLPFSKNVHRDSRFLVDFVGTRQLVIDGKPIEGPYAVFLKPPEGLPEYLHSAKSVYYAVQQAKADQRNWGLPDTKVQVSEPCRLILDIEIAQFKHLRSLGISTFET